MKALGHPLTYQTTCFIDGGCGEVVFAHTNGEGDFVLFDTLGAPWPIHDCYLSRFCSVREGDEKVETDQEWALESARHHREYKEAARKASEHRNRRPTQEITKVAPVADKAIVRVVGYVQDIIEKRPIKTLSGAGSLAQQSIRKALGNRESQITIIDSDFRSYTAFADLHQTVLSKRTTVIATIKSQNVFGLGNIFLCQDLEVLPVKPGT